MSLIQPLESSLSVVKEVEALEHGGDSTIEIKMPPKEVISAALPGTKYYSPPAEEDFYVPPGR